ncbi:MAG: hypothetical protein D3923_02060 [Candidatus Electrothrix sp. AR3]|nr:hypothetical protein [Candidatus Electrothrix sp. AR3]
MIVFVKLYLLLSEEVEVKNKLRYLLIKKAKRLIIFMCFKWLVARYSGGIDQKVVKFLVKSLKKVKLFRFPFGEHPVNTGLSSSVYARFRGQFSYEYFLSSKN